MMDEKRFMCIDVGYGDDWYIIDNGKRLSEMEIVDLLNEQQATINKLQDENEQLREINKEIGDDLHNCRINKNIIRDKLKLWQDVHKEYGIYSIKDFEESFELDAKINKEKGI